MRLLAFAMLSLGIAIQAEPLTLTRDGKPTATIVIAARPTTAAAFAALELREHVQLITGADLPVVSADTEVTGARILVGPSAATRALGIDETALGDQEYLVRWLPDTLVLLGRDAPNPCGIAVTGAPAWAAGRFGKALHFDGANDTLGLTALTFPDAAGTLEAWIYLDADASGQVFRIDGSPWSYHIVDVKDGRVTYRSYDGKQGTAVQSPVLAPGWWHHLAASWDAAAGELALAVDGAVCGTAAYLPTHGAGQPLYVGGSMFQAPAGKPNGPFTGAVDEIRVSRIARPPAFPDGPPMLDDAALLVLHLDEGEGLPGLSFRGSPPRVLPGMFEEQGTCHAVYRFLERQCGVRWYGPTDLGRVYDRQPTLTVSGEDVRRRPAMGYRYILYPPYPVPGFPMNMILWDNPDREQMRLYWQRMRNGGQHYGANHSFYGYYDRFWEENPRNPKVFEEHHADWFAQGYEGLPPQMCYTNPGFTAQVVQDARDYFDGKGLKHRAQAGGDFFALVPMDNHTHCKCPQCQALLNAAEADNPHFSNGKSSDLVFGFANEVAAAIAESHPDKYLATLAYADYAYYPTTVRLRPNISVMLCLAVNNWWCPSAQMNDLKVYHSWVDREKDRPIYVWLYAEFPEEIGYGQGWKFFPGFDARLIARQMKMFAADGIRGLFLNGTSQQLNCYMYNQMALDPGQDADGIIAEFLRRYYGPAEAPMRALWTEIEAVYRDPANYPPEVELSMKDWHQTEEIAWEWLGTAERMARWGAAMDEATRLAAADPVFSRRVALFAEGVWEHMVAGRREWLRKSRFRDEVRALEQQPPPAAAVPRCAAPANGDPDAVAWDAVPGIRIFRNVQGYPTDRQVEARLAHDGANLYLRLTDRLGGKPPVGNDGIWGGDDWEIFVAAQRAKPYRQLGINPAGHRIANAVGEPQAWDSGAVVHSVVADDVWTTTVAMPLARLVPGGVKPGDTFYLNLIHGGTAGRESLGWSPHFSSSFHQPARLGELTLE